MGSRYEVEVVISSAKDLKNINWEYGTLRPYAVVWVDQDKKSSTRVDEEGDNFPVWDQNLTIPLPPSGSLESHVLHVDIVHAARPDEDTKPLIGSAKLPLRDVLDDVGLSGERFKKSLTLKRPSGRPHGKVEVKVSVRDIRYHAPDAYYAPPYGVPPPASSGSRDHYATGPPPSGYGSPYGSAPYGYGAPPPVQQPYGYSDPAPYGGGYNNAPPQQGYGGAAGYTGGEEKKKSKFGGMGTGLAVGAVAGVLGGIALVEGFDALEDKIADDAAEKVEEDLGYDDDDE
uniref:Putative C2 domain-protein binding n=1 Tax=Linum usitatissimum TaxID=4006 RepID=A0A172MLE1_LINUS|nr:putative C2 domain-protein binding [Linum usitatissimum]